MRRFGTSAKSSHLQFAEPRLSVTMRSGGDENQTVRIKSLSVKHAMENSAGKFESQGPVTCADSAE